MHIPVMAEAALAWLAVRPDGVYIDCTAGAGGHSERIARQLNPDSGRLIALDRDPSAVALTQERLAPFACAGVLHRPYAELADVAREEGLPPLDGVLIDAGVSSMQLDTASRGFSFQADGPLDMRMDPERGEPASVWLATVDEDDLVHILRRYGDVRPAGRIAKAVKRRAGEQRLNSTRDLAEAVGEALNVKGRDPEETRMVFQAVRIAVNEELEQLTQAVEAAVELLAPGGRLVVLSFHSGEDRVVKDRLRAEGRPHRELHPDGRVKAVRQPRLKVLTPKPERPTADEIAQNARAASARLRAAERLPEYRE